jgi:hypothetical protein
LNVGCRVEIIYNSFQKEYQSNKKNCNDDEKQCETPSKDECYHWGGIDTIHEHVLLKKI